MVGDLERAGLICFEKFRLELEKSDMTSRAGLFFFRPKLILDFGFLTNGEIALLSDVPICMMPSRVISRGGGSYILSLSTYIGDSFL